MSSRDRQFRCCKCERRTGTKAWNSEKRCSKCRHEKCRRCKTTGERGIQDEAPEDISQYSSTPLPYSQSWSTNSSNQPSYSSHQSSHSASIDASYQPTAITIPMSLYVPTSAISPYEGGTVPYQSSANIQIDPVNFSQAHDLVGPNLSATYTPRASNANVMPMYSSSPAPLFGSKGVQKRLPIKLDGRRIDDACADTGSQINCMSSEIAKMLRVKTTKTLQRFRLPIRGYSVGAFATAKLKCEFPTAPNMPSSPIFFIFKNLASGVIMGREFLRDTRTLDLHPHRLENHHETALKRPVPTLCFVGAVEEYVYCWLNGVRHWCLPDTGATINLISPEAANELQLQATSSPYTVEGQTSSPGITRPYVSYSASTSLGYGAKETSTYTHPGSASAESYDGSNSYSSGGAAIEKITPIAIELVDGSEFWSDSRIHITIAFSGPEDKSPITEPFYILEGLEPAVIIGGSLLHDADAYSRYPENFVEFPHDQLPAIAWGAKKKQGEGTNRSIPQRSESQILHDEYSLKCDRVEADKDRIEDQYRRGQIDDNTRQRDLSNANRATSEWLRERREVVERCWGTHWYRKNVPREL